VPQAENRSSETRRRRARADAGRLALVYAVLGTIYILFSDRVVTLLRLPADVTNEINSTKGVLFILVTALLLYAAVGNYLRDLYDTEERYRTAQGRVLRQEEAIRQAYIDVLDAVTGGKLVLMRPDELEADLGKDVVPAQPLHGPEQLGEARAKLRDALAELHPADEEGFLLAVSEALTNAIKHGGGGEWCVRRTRTAVQVVVDDYGTGIDFRTLPKATLVPGFSTKQSLGMGFTIMLDVCDRLLLTTQPGRTTLVLEMHLAPVPARERETAGNRA
jgi:anti-sigma regulatory factor (Ser/Thr protein kinase)